MSKWRTIRLNEDEPNPFGDVPRRPGLYAIYAGTHLNYIGRSDSDISRRVEAHLSPASGQWDGLYNVLWSCVAKPDQITIKVSVGRDVRTLPAAERGLIRRLNPLCNKQHRTGAPAWHAALERDLNIAWCQEDC